MAATQITLVNGVSITIAATPTALYSSPDSASPLNGTGTLISAFTITNSEGSNIAYKCWVVPSGSVVGDAFLLVPSRIVKPSKTDVPYEVIGHLMPANSVLYVESDTASAANIRVSGVALSIS